MRYYIEQAKDRFYDPATLPAAKTRARRLSKTSDGLVYVIAERFDPDLRDYAAVGSIAFGNGYQDAVEGETA